MSPTILDPQIDAGAQSSLMEIQDEQCNIPNYKNQSLLVCRDAETINLVNQIDREYQKKQDEN